MRSRVFAPRTFHRDAHRHIACDLVAAKLIQRWEIFDPADYRKALVRDEISARFASAIDPLPGAIPMLWASKILRREEEARSLVATRFCETLEALTIVTSGPPPGPLLDGVTFFKIPPVPAYAYLDRWP